MLDITKNYLTKQPSKYRNEREELVALYVEAINRERIGTKFKPITPRQVAIRLNSNPMLKSDNEVRWLYHECLKVGFKKFFWLCPLKKI